MWTWWKRASGSWSGSSERGRGVKSVGLLAGVLLGAILVPPVARAADPAHEMEVLGLQLEPRSRATALLLRSRDQDKRELTLYIGTLEATAIAVPLQNLRPPRPLTHDLLVELIHRFNGRVKRVLIRGIQDNAYMADLVIEAGGREMVFDVRPSDAIALALRESAPIFAADAAFAAPAAPQEAP
jgi:bifunctional DNase/RNase